MQLPHWGDVVVLGHAITMPIGYRATAGSLIYAGERLVWPSGAVLRFDTTSALVNTAPNRDNHLTCSAPPF
ncbi:hypothetical protein [Rudanella lutea]|uniref:hypothetical protein n=1 Tax=Rudanella lutea TaxID=451374 RepID=UPI00039DCA73|nr:hypothetical protein [Rudanella lutea]